MNKISILFYKQLTGTITEAEKRELEAWMAESAHNAEVGRRLSDPEYLEREYRLQGLVDKERVRADMERRIKAADARSWRRWIVPVAASVAVVICVAAWLRGSHLPDLTSVPGKEMAAAPKIISIDEIEPGESMAVLSDEAGNKIVLKDTDAAVPAAWEGRVAGMAQKIEELKLDVPRGKEFKIMLEDSTEVWLNSESVLRYPRMFSEGERRVEVEGEAYFKVKKDEARPFYVVAEGQQIRVYGTTFNVRNYNDENTVQTTLETGSIALTLRDNAEGGELRLQPGHQAVFTKSDAQVNLKTVKPEVITGWHHGRFVFEEQPLSTIMRDLARWYDFEYEFADEAVSRLVFKGSIPRYANLRTAIDILEGSGGISFSVADNRIIIATDRSE